MDKHKRYIRMAAKRNELDIVKCIQKTVGVSGKIYEKGASFDFVLNSFDAIKFLKAIQPFLLAQYDASVAYLKSYDVDSVPKRSDFEVDEPIVDEPIEVDEPDEVDALLS